MTKKPLPEMKALTNTLEAAWAVEQHITAMHELANHLDDCGYRQTALAVRNSIPSWRELLDRMQEGY